MLRLWRTRKAKTEEFKPAEPAPMPRNERSPLAASPMSSAIQHSGYPGRIVVDQPSREFEARATKIDRSDSLGSSVADTVVDGWSTDSYCVRAASVRGDTHRFSGLPRQDDLLITCHPASGSLIVAVADGLSSAPVSHHGANAACRYATGAILDSLNHGVTIVWQDVFKNAAWALVELARRRIGGDADARVAEELFATTLTIAVLTPSSDHRTRLSVAGVGDSAVWLLRENNLEWLAGGKDLSRGDEPFSSATAALPRLPVTINPAEFDIGSGDALLVISDGIGDPLGDGTGLVGDLMRSELRTPPAALQVARIADFSRATFTDDRTLAVVWPKAQAEDGDLVD